jgi:hypothetical protein
MQSVFAILRQRNPRIYFFAFGRVIFPLSTVQSRVKNAAAHCVVGIKRAHEIIAENNKD